MKFIFIICLTLIAYNKSYSQDSLYRNAIQAAMEDFSKNSFVVNGYKKLPEYIRNYMDQKMDGKFRLTNHKFNATDIGSGKFSRKLLYAAGSNDVYILGYEHGGRGYHCHAIIFRTNGKDVVNMYNLVTKKHQVSELADILKHESYIVQKHDDF